MPKKYCSASICLKGHIVDKENTIVNEFCSSCGSMVVTACPSCNRRIRGLEFGEFGVFDELLYKLPYYCPICAEPYPWTKMLLDNAVELLSLDEDLSEEYRRIIKDAIPDLIVESIATPLAAAKFKKYTGYAKDFVKDSLYLLLKDIVITSVKKVIF